MRVLLDTNVLAGGIVGAHLDWQTPPTRIRRYWLEERFELLISDHVLDELERVLDRPWFAARIDPETRTRSVQRLTEQAVLVQPELSVAGVAGHPSDDLVLAAAISGNADYLVTGDAKFRRVDEFRGVSIRTPAEFLSELESTLVSS